jgi:protein-disulfide isomerase
MKTEIVKLTLPVSSDRDHIQGRTSAPVTLIEYGDYECPYCGQAYPIIKEVQKQLGNKLCFVFRNFPLTEIHPHAEHAAEAAEAAAGQNRFWEMHDYIYEHQQLDLGMRRDTGLPRFWCVPARPFQPFGLPVLSLIG